MAICPAGQAGVCLGGGVLLGPLGPMVRGRALVPGALGSACLLPPHGCGCQPQSHVCIPKVPTGRIGKLRLAEVPRHEIMEPVVGKARRGGQKACLWTPGVTTRHHREEHGKGRTRTSLEEPPPIDPIIPPKPRFVRRKR